VVLVECDIVEAGHVEGGEGWRGGEEKECDIGIKVAALASQDTCNAQSW